MAELEPAALNLLTPDLFLYRSHVFLPPSPRVPPTTQRETHPL